PPRRGAASPRRSSRPRGARRPCGKGRRATRRPWPKCRAGERTAGWVGQRPGRFGDLVAHSATNAPSRWISTLALLPYLPYLRPERLHPVEDGVGHLVL